MILLPLVGEQELRSLSNMIFQQVENDGAMDREVIPMENERGRYSLTSAYANSKSS